MPHTTTNKGLHDFVDDRVLINHARAGVRAVDLGSGPGAMACRLRRRGCDVLAADLSADVFALDLPHVSVNFNELNFASKPGRNVFALATAIEVIETPIGFLRNIRELLAPGGVAVLTTPNVDSLPALFKFLLSQKIRTMDAHGEPTHFHPSSSIFCAASTCLSLACAFASIFSSLGIVSNSVASLLPGSCD